MIGGIIINKVMNKQNKIINAKLINYLLHAEF